MKKKIVLSLLCILVVFTFIPVRAFGIDLDRSKLFVSGPTYYEDNSVASLDISYTYPSNQGTSSKCTVVLNQNIGSGGMLFSTYGRSYDNFQQSLDGIGGVVTYDESWKSVSSSDLVSVTTNFDKGALSLSYNARYYVYMWAFYNNHYYPDELLAILEVRDGKLYYTSDINSEYVNVGVTEHRLTYTLNSNKDTITESCSDCDHSETLSISTSDMVFNNSAYNRVRLSSTDGLIGTLGLINYYSTSTKGATTGGTPLTSAPTAVGNYYASVILGDKTAVSAFSINEKSYNVSVDNDGNGSASANLSSGIRGTEITLTATPHSGYIFDEWQVLSGDVSISSNSFNMPEEDVSIKAKFKPALYSITYKDEDDGVFSGTHEIVTPVSHTYNSITILKNALKVGYQFGGWFTSPSCDGTPLLSLSATGYTNDITLYAKWTAKDYLITYDDNDATTAHSGGATSYNIESTTLTMPTAPERTGYTFEGWKITTGAEDGTGLEVNNLVTDESIDILNAYGDVTLTAQWNLIPIIKININVDSEENSAIVGYKKQDPYTFTIRNEGNQPTDKLLITLLGKDADSFTINKKEISSIDMGGQEQFTVVPNKNLKVGSYEAKVEVTSSDNGDLISSFDVNFTVQPIRGEVDKTSNEPNTGDNDSLNMYLGAIMISIQVSIALMLYMCKKKKVA